MFFKNIDSWSKKKLILVTVLVALAYFMAASIVPCIFIAHNYQVFRTSNFRLTGAGLIIIIILVSFGGKAIKALLSFLPRDTQKQQIFRYSLELVFGMIVPALALWGIHLFRANVDLACQTAMQCIISIMVAVLINNIALKSLMYQWQCMSEVSHNKKIRRMETAQQ